MNSLRAGIIGGILGAALAVSSVLYYTRNKTSGEIWSRAERDGFIRLGAEFKNPDGLQSIIVRMEERRNEHIIFNEDYSSNAAYPQTEKFIDFDKLKEYREILTALATEEGWKYDGRNVYFTADVQGRDGKHKGFVKKVYIPSIEERKRLYEADKKERDEKSIAKLREKLGAK